MRLYSTHFHASDSMTPERPPLLVREGISWPCLVLGWMGLLLSGSWIAAFLIAAASVALGLALRPLTGGWPVLAGAQLLLALFANDLRRWELGLRGFIPGPIVSGRNPDAALLRLLDCRPDLLGRPEPLGDRA